MTASPAVALPLSFLHDLATATTRLEVIEITTRWLPQIVGADQASVLQPADDHHLELVAIDAEIMPRGLYLPIDGSLAGRSHTTRSPIVVDDLEHDDSIESSAHATDGLRSALVSPMVHAGRSLGTINLGSRNARAFTDNDVETLTGLADLVAGFLAAHHRADAEHVRAQTDVLTGTLSRTAVLHSLVEAFDERHSPSLLLVDIDWFKAVNDRYGHSFGDDLLRTLARRIERCLRPGDRLGRYGGDEFLVVVPDDPDGVWARALAEEIADASAIAATIGPTTIHPSVSIGLASITAATTSAAALLNEAREALYVGKESGRAIVADDAIRKRITMLNAIDRDLEAAFDAHEVTYHFQPIRDLSTNEIMGAEALIRWNHPRLGWIPADLLIGRIERTGRIDQLTEWSLRTVAQMWSDVRAQIDWFHDKACSVNLSPRQLSWHGCADLHDEVVRQHRLRPVDIIVEVVESDEIGVGHTAEWTLRRLGDAGAVIALDDFGTGHNSLRYFTRFPIHAIKFDRSLTTMLTSDHRARAIVKGLALTADDLSVMTLGEGIETQSMVDDCLRAHVRHGQGWHLGRPMDIASFVATARSEAPTKEATTATLADDVPCGLAPNTPQ